MPSDYYDTIPCPTRPGFCTIEHVRLNRRRWREAQSDPAKIGKRLLEAATGPMYFLYLAPYGCFGGKQVVSYDGKVVITTDPDRYGRGTTVWVDNGFLNTTPHILIDELEPELVDSFLLLDE